MANVAMPEAFWIFNIVGKLFLVRKDKTGQQPHESPHNDRGGNYSHR